MPTLEIHIPANHHQFNRERWAEILKDEYLSDLPGKVESNRHGHVLMVPPASGGHSKFQGEIAYQLRVIMGRGRSLPECPISTQNGVRAADVAWYSDERFAEVEGQLVFEKAAEICVEVLSPSNTDCEMIEKRSLYFEAGAKEVWICDLEGKMEFFISGSERSSESKICPEFPRSV